MLLKRHCCIHFQKDLSVMMAVLVCNVSRYGYSVILWSISEIPNKMVVLVFSVHRYSSRVIVEVIPRKT